MVQALAGFAARSLFTAMEPLHRMFDLATSSGAISPITHQSARILASLYADDVVLFLNLVKEEVSITKDLLASFGLPVQSQIWRKTTVFLIQCNGVDLVDTMECFQCPVKAFPCKYLGLPLHVRAL